MPNEPIALALEKCTQMLRRLGDNIQIGANPNTQLPVVLFPAARDLYTPTGFHPTPDAYLICQPLKEHMKAAINNPPSLGDFTPQQIMALERIGHDLRIKAAVETVALARKHQLDDSDEAYQCALAAWGDDKINFLLRSIPRMEEKINIFSPIAEYYDPTVHRHISHCFAGMALNSLIQPQKSLQRFFGLASCAISFSPNDLKLAAFLRVQLLTYAKHAIGLTSLHAPDEMLECTHPPSINFEDWFDATMNRGNIVAIYDAYNEKLLLPMVARLKPEWIEFERAIVANFDPAMAFANMLNQRMHDVASGTIPAASKSGRTASIVDGKIIEKVCRSCGKWETDGNFFRCAQCKLAFYCNKQCQVQHWPRHKHECKKKTQ